MRVLRTFIVAIVLGCASSAFAQSALINEQGTAGVPVSVQACSGGSTKTIASVYSSTTWTLMPEGADIRCEQRALPDGAAVITPTATVGFLFKSNVLVAEPTLNIGGTAARLGLDCCGVAGAVSVDTWHE